MICFSNRHASLAKENHLLSNKSLRLPCKVLACRFQLKLFQLQFLKLKLYINRE